MNIPCKECIVFVSCKTRYKGKAKFFMDEKFGGSVCDLAIDEDCNRLRAYINDADQDDMNDVRLLFGMEPYP